MRQFVWLSPLLLTLTCCCTQGQSAAPRAAERPAPATTPAESPAAPAAEHDHAAEHDAAPQPRPRAEVIAPIAIARQTRLETARAATSAFLAQVQSAVTNAADADRPALTQLQSQLQTQSQTLAKGAFLLDFVAEEDPFTLDVLSTARAAYVEQLRLMQERYVEDLGLALREDHWGYIGDLMIAELSTSTDLDLMSLLMDWYWHHEHLDTPPASFERIIRMGYRYVEVEPTAGSIYCNTAWLLWSRWVTWKQDPEKMPIGAGGAEAAQQVLLRGRAANPTDAAHLFEAAMTLWGLARFHDQKYYQFILDSLHQAEQCAKEPQLHARIRMTLGHVYKQLGQREQAKQWYEKVLEVDPENEIAPRILREEFAAPAANQSA